jgi:EmrB/QacA subfamily drug resistance transporter
MKIPLVQVPIGRRLPVLLFTVGHSSMSSLERGILAVIAMGALVTSLDASIVGLSLPAIAKAFGTPVGHRVEWVIIAYLVVVAALLISFGRLSDVVSRGPLWITGLAIFTLGSALSGMAPSLDLLIAARMFQGIGGALVVATGVAILGDTFLSDQRGIALGIVGMASALSSCVGPILGGTINDHLNWRLIFFITVPIGIAAIFLGWRVLPRGAFSSRPRLDIVGALIFGLGIAGLSIALWFGGVWGWRSPRFIGGIGIAMLALMTAVLVDRRAATPLIDHSIFRQRYFRSALSRLLLSRLALMAPSFLLPFYLLQLRDFSAQTAGLLMAPFPLAVMALSPISGALIDRFHTHWLEASGLAVIVASLVWLARLDTSSSTLEIGAVLALVGVGQGLFTTPNSKAILDAAPQVEEGEASGLLSTGRVVGQSVSIALSSAIFATLGSGAAGTLLSQHGSTLSPLRLASTQATFLHGFQLALLVSAAFAAIAVLVACAQAISASEFPSLRRALFAGAVERAARPPVAASRLLSHHALSVHGRDSSTPAETNR